MAIPSASMQNLSEAVATPPPMVRSQSASSGLVGAPKPPSKAAGALPQRGLVDLSQELMDAIAAGDLNAAELAVRQLSLLNANLEILPKSSQPEHMLSLKIHFEDIEKSSGHVIMEFKRTWTIRQLKYKMLSEYGFPPEIQVWIVKRRIAQDEDSLEKLGLKAGETHNVYLYLASRETVGLTKTQYHRKYGMLWADTTQESMPELCEAVAESGSAGGAVSGACQATVLPSGAAASLVCQPEDPVMSLAAAGMGGLEQVYNQTSAAVPTTPINDTRIEQETPGWTCGVCTFKNVPTRPGCEMCAAPRPDDYAVPEMPDEQLPEAERLRLEQERFLEQQLKQDAAIARGQLLFDLAEQDADTMSALILSSLDLEADKTDDEPDGQTDSFHSLS